MSGIAPFTGSVKRSSSHLESMTRPVHILSPSDVSVSGNAEMYFTILVSSMLFGRVSEPSFSSTMKL
jgi:hypothetical protein